MADGELFQRGRKRARDHSWSLDATATVPPRGRALGRAAGQHQDIAHLDVDGGVRGRAHLDAHVTDVLPSAIEARLRLFEQVGSFRAQGHELVGCDACDRQFAPLVSHVAKAKLVALVHGREDVVGQDQELIGP